MKKLLILQNAHFLQHFEAESIELYSFDMFQPAQFLVEDKLLNELVGRLVNNEYSKVVLNTNHITSFDFIYGYISAICKALHIRFQVNCID